MSKSNIHDMIEACCEMAVKTYGLEEENIEVCAPHFQFEVTDIKLFEQMIKEGPAAYVTSSNNNTTYAQFKISEKWPELINRYFYQDTILVLYYVKGEEEENV